MAKVHPIDPDDLRHQADEALEEIAEAAENERPQEDEEPEAAVEAGPPVDVEELADDVLAIGHLISLGILYLRARRRPERATARRDAAPGDARGKRAALRVARRIARVGGTLPELTFWAGVASDLVTPGVEEALDDLAAAASHEDDE